MKRRLSVVIALGTILVSGWASRALAQDAVMPIDNDEMRYQFMAHNFIVDGVEQEIYLKLDRFTGDTWRFHASNPRWVPVPESTTGAAREAGSQSRYELLPHNYFDQNGDPQELYIRADLVTGSTWVYRGANGTWREVSQDAPAAPPATQTSQQTVPQPTPQLAPQSMQQTVQQ
jgi:hypothetical protein